jgi:quercetin dioxygenase-like cupin family protein
MVSGALAGFVVSSPWLFNTVAAQSGAPAAERVWENDRMEVHRVSLAPGERLSRESVAGSVIVFLTTDLDGRVPAVDATWQDAGPATLENRGRARFEALIVDLKGSAMSSGGVTPPEVVRASGKAARSDFAGTYASMRRAQNVILNDRVSVTKERYPSAWSDDSLHFHPHDTVVIYLRGGYLWPTTWFYGPERVRRGDVRIVPGNVLHTTDNAGSDPMEFLLIIPA